MYLVLVVTYSLIRSSKYVQPYEALTSLNFSLQLWNLLSPDEFGLWHFHAAKFCDPVSSRQYATFELCENKRTETRLRRLVCSFNCANKEKCKVINSEPNLFFISSSSTDFRHFKHKFYNFKHKFRASFGSSSIFSNESWLVVQIENETISIRKCFWGYL